VVPVALTCAETNNIAAEDGLKVVDHCLLGGRKLMPILTKISICQPTREINPPLTSSD